MKKLISAIILVSLTAGVFAHPNLLKKEQFGASAIDTITADLSSETIEIKETFDTSSIEVEIYCNYKKHAPDVSVSGSTLSIEGNAARPLFPAPARFSCNVIIYIPSKKDFDEIDFRTTSGDIEIKKALSAKSKINISSTSGDIKSDQGLFSDSIKVSASSGDIELYNMDADDFSVKTSSGGIVIKKFTGETGNINSTSGDIKADDYACEYAKFESTSGEINIKKFDCDYFDAESTSGNIVLDLKNAPAATSSVECTSGDIDIYLPMRSKFSVDVSCTSGTFRDKFNNNRMNPRDTYHQEYNGGGPAIKLRTTSGNVTLDY